MYSAVTVLGAARNTASSHHYFSGCATKAMQLNPTSAPMILCGGGGLASAASNLYILDIRYRVLIFSRLIFASVDICDGSVFPTDA